MPESSPIADAVAALKRGELIVFPTETLYGLGCDARNELAVRRLFALKGRAAQGDDFKPPPILVRDLEMLQMWAEVSPFAQDLISQYWPGALTLVLPALPNAPDWLCGENNNARTIGVRASAHPIAHALVTRLGAPVIATSANPSGASGHAAAPQRLDEVSSEILARVDGALDGGTVGGVASTVLDCTTSPPRVLRPGAVTLNLP